MVCHVTTILYSVGLRYCASIVAVKGLRRSFCCVEFLCHCPCLPIGHMHRNGQTEFGLNRPNGNEKFDFVAIVWLLWTIDAVWEWPEVTKFLSLISCLSLVFLLHVMNILPSSITGLTTYWWLRYGQSRWDNDQTESMRTCAHGLIVGCVAMLCR